MVDFIILIIFIFSLAGVLFIVARKVPALNSLPANGSAGIKDHKMVAGARGKIKKILVFFEKQIILHKFLSWAKRMTMKFETKIDYLLHKIRKKNQQIDKK